MMASKETALFEHVHSRILASENMHKIIDDIFAEDVDGYLEHPEKLVENLKECILPFRKTCKSLNLVNTEAANGDLVRMRCMIRESKGFEMFPMGTKIMNEIGSQVSCGLFRDSFVFMNANEKEMKLGTRYNYVVSSVPGASDWYDDTFYDLKAKSGEAEINSLDVHCAKESCRTIAKFFDESCSDLEPNRVFDLFGILDTTEICDDEAKESSDIPSRSFHVIGFEPVEDHKVLNQELPLISDNNVAAISLIRKSLTLLIGDESAAEYLLCHLASKTYVRPVGNPVCSMAMNIINVTNPSSIIRHIKLLMPKVLVFEVSKETLCTDSLIPKMNYETEFLEKGILQLSSGTVFIIDETKFSMASVEGVSEEKKRILNKNLRALRRLVKEQVFEYDYTHYPITLYSDVNVLVLSKEPSNLNLELPFSLAIPIQFCDGIDPANVIQQDLILRECRHALQVCRNSVKLISIPQNINKEITDTFVQNRSSGTATVDACDQLHRLLTITRLITALDCKLEVSSSHWIRAQNMEKERVKVLNDFLKKPR